MRLIELYVENFGKLHGFRYTFRSGLNVINEDNGYGKSTLTVFIKSMLFGLEDTKKAKLEENDRKKYMPWQGGACGGSLTFSVGEKKYRIERTFAPKASEDTFALYDCESGKLSDDYGENLGEELFGINADGFERTVFLSERRLSVKNDNKTISAKLSDLVGCDADVGDLDAAVKLLEERRKYYKKKGDTGKISDIKAEISEVELEINDAHRTKDSLPEKQARLAAVAGEIAALEKRLAEFESQRLARASARQYADKRARLDEARARLAEVKGFFEGGIPSAAEIREAERCADECRVLTEKLGDSVAADSDAALCAEIGEVTALIDGYNAERTKGKPKKAYPALFASFGLLLAAIVIFIFTENWFMCAVDVGCAAVFLAAAVANLTACKKAEAPSEVVLKIRALLGREGKSHTEESDYLAALLEIKLRREGELKRCEDEREAARGDRLRLEELIRARDGFLSRFHTATGDPFSEIRARIAELERLEYRVRELEGELQGFATAHGINEAKISAEELRELTAEDRSALEAEINAKRREFTLLEREIRTDCDIISRLDELTARRAELCEERDKAQITYETINLTKKYLTAAKDSLTAKYLGKTRAAFAEYISAIGNDDPELFSMDTSFAVMRSEGGNSMPTEAYSLGTRELFSLASRLALVDSLYEKELPFIILDDPFAHFDDGRAALALKLIKRLADKRQIIYFTCSKSRAI
ncbi:MAG: AAA family ATPase [Clostridia bacterium]|nr:AAA family ATPase [Clostridia bacterium]